MFLFLSFGDSFTINVPSVYKVVVALTKFTVHVVSFVTFSMVIILSLIVPI